MRPELMLVSCTTPNNYWTTSNILSLWYQYLPYVNLNYRDEYTKALVLASTALLDALSLTTDEHAQFKTFLADTFEVLPTSFMKRCHVLGPLTETFARSFLGQAVLMNTMDMDIVNPAVDLPLLEISR